MLPPLMPKPLKSRMKLQPLPPMRRETQWPQADGDLKAPLRVLGARRGARVIATMRRALISKGGD